MNAYGRLSQSIRITLAFLAVGLTVYGQRVITTVAGTDYVFPGASEPSSNVVLRYPFGVAVDASGNVYVSDLQTEVVLKITPAGVASVYAGNGFFYHSGDGGPATAAGLAGPQGMAMDSAGNLYIAELVNVRRVDTHGIVTTVAGNGLQESSGDGGPATEAGLYGPTDVAVDTAGTLYIADQRANRVRRVDPSGIITTYAGTGTEGYTGDGGPAAKANIQVNAIAIDAKQNLYIADSINGVIRMVTPQGIISTFAGGPNTRGFYTNGPAVGAQIGPSGVAAGANGTLYFTNGAYVFQVSGGQLSPVATVADNGLVGITVSNQGGIYITDAQDLSVLMLRQGTTVVSTVASSTLAGTIGNGGPALSAYLDDPFAIAFDHKGGYYIADAAGEVVRYVNAQGIINTVAGTGKAGYSGDGGPANQAQISSPISVAVDFAGNLYISDAGNGRIRRVSQGIISTYLGGVGGQFADSSPLASAVIGVLRGLAFSPAGELYFGDAYYGRVRRITGGNVVTYAGNGGSAFPSNGAATSQPIGDPRTLAFAPSGDLYVQSTVGSTGASAIFKITPNGALTAFAGTGVFGYTNDGVPAVSAQLDQPSGLTVDPAGTVYFTEFYTGLIRSVGSDGILRTAAGSNDFDETFGGDGGPAVGSHLNRPLDVKSDAAGNLFIADTDNHRIREVLANPPTLSVNTTSLRFEAPSGGAPTQAQSVQLTGSIPGVQFTVAITPSSAAQWIIPSYSSGATPLILTFQANPSSLASGTYAALITINSPSAMPASQTISATFVVDPGQPPTLQLDKSSLSFGFPNQGTVRSQLVQVKNIGGGELLFTVTTSTQSGGPWLSASPSSGTALPGNPAILTITADPSGLRTGTYQALVTVTSGSQSMSVLVVASVSALNQAILLGQAGLSFLAVSGGGIVPPQSFGVYNTGIGVMSWNVSTSTASGGPNWLQATPGQGSSDASSSTIPRVTVTVNPAGLAPGRYYGLVRVTSPTAANSPQVVTATLELLPPGQDPGAVVQPAQLNFFFPTDFDGQGGIGRPAAQSLTIYDLSAKSSNFVAQSAFINGSNQLVLAPFTSTVEPQAPAQVLVQPIAPITPATTVTIQFDDGVLRQVPIVFTTGSSTSGTQGVQHRQASPSGCTPQRLIPALSAIGELATHVNAGWPTALTVNVQDDCGQPQSAGTVTVSFSNGDSPIPLQSSNDGNWEGTWQNSYGDAGAVTISIVAADPSRSLSGSAQSVANLLALQEPPVFAAAGVVNNADPVANVPIGLGSIVSIYGNQLAVSPASFVNAPLPTTLGQTRVFIAGEFVPLYFASPTLINFQVPYDIQPDTIQQIVVQQGNTLSIPVQVNVAQAQPASFLNSANGPAAALAYVLRNGSGFEATPSTPAQAGDELILYCSGLGSVGQFTAGQAAPLTTNFQTQNPVTVTIGGVAITPDFAGLAPSFVGLYQVNVRVPSGVPSGSAVPMTIQVLNLVSPTITIPIQ